MSKRHAELKRTERRREVLDWYSRGLTMRQVADQMGLALPTVHRDIDKALRISAAAYEEATGGPMRAFITDQCERLIRVYMPRALTGDATAVAVVDSQHAKIRRMWGIDKPIKVAVGGDPDNPYPIKTLDQLAHEFKDVPLNGSGSIIEGNGHIVGGDD